MTSQSQARKLQLSFTIRYVTCILTSTKLMPAYSEALNNVDPARAHLVLVG
jgi:hypothetical protein